MEDREGGVPYRDHFQESELKLTGEKSINFLYGSSWQMPTRAGFLCRTLAIFP